MVTREFYAQATAQQIAEEWLQRKIEGKRVVRSAESIYNKPTLEQAEKIKQANVIYSQLVSKPEAQRLITRASERKVAQRELQAEAQRRGFKDPREFAVRRQQLQESIAEKRRAQRDRKFADPSDTTKAQEGQVQEVRRITMDEQVTTARIEKIERGEGIDVSRGGVFDKRKVSAIEIPPVLVRGAEKFKAFEGGLSKPLTEEQRKGVADVLFQVILPKESPEIQERKVILSEKGLQSVGEQQQKAQTIQKLPETRGAKFSPTLYTQDNFYKQFLSNVVLRATPRDLFKGVKTIGQAGIDIGGGILTQRQQIAETLFDVITPKVPAKVQESKLLLTTGGLKSVGDVQQQESILRKLPQSKEVTFSPQFYKNRGLLEYGVSEVVLRGVGTGSAVAGGSIRYAGERPITTGALVGLGFGSKVVSAGLISRGGLTAFSTKAALTTAGAAGVGVELGRTALTEGEIARATRLGESITKFGAVAYGSKLGGKLTDPKLSKEELTRLKELSEKIPDSQRQRIFIREDSKRFTKTVAEGDFKLRLSSRDVGKIVDLGGRKFAVGVTETRVFKYGQLISKGKQSFIAPIRDVTGKPSIKLIDIKNAYSSIGIRAEQSYEQSLGATFTGETRPANIRLGVLYKDSRLFPSFQQYKRVPSVSDLPRFQKAGAGKVITVPNLKRMFILPDKGGQLLPRQLQAPKTTLTLAPKVTQLQAGGFASQVSSLQTEVSPFKPLNLKQFPVQGLVPSFSSKVLTQTSTRPSVSTKLAKGLSLKTGLQSVLSTQTVSTTTTQNVSQAVASKTTTLKPAPALTQVLKPTVLVPTTPVRLKTPPATGIFLPPFDFETPKRKKKKKKGKPSLQKRVLAQDLTAKVLKLEPVKVTRKKARRLKTKPLGIRRGVIIE